MWNDSPRSGEARVRLGIGELHASAGDHVGHFYETRTEWRDLLTGFLGTGLEAGEKCVYLMGADSDMDDLREGLVIAGIDVDGAADSGQLVLREGFSDPEGLQRTAQDCLVEVPGKHPLLRWGGDMSWSLRRFESCRMLMEMESWFNTLGKVPAVFLCQYDLTAFQGYTVIEAMRTHPITVTGQSIHRSPYYERPDTILDGLRRRDATRHAPW